MDEELLEEEEATSSIDADVNIGRMLARLVLVAPDWRAFKALLDDAILAARLGDTVEIHGGVDESAGRCATGKERRESIFSLFFASNSTRQQQFFFRFSRSVCFSLFSLFFQPRPLSSLFFFGHSIPRGISVDTQIKTRIE